VTPGSHARTGRLLAWSAALVALPALAADPPDSAPTAAPPDKYACLANYEQAQLDRRNAQLIQARSKLRICSQAECPDVVRGDCMTWLGEVEAGIPSVIFEAHADGEMLTNVSVAVDDILVRSTLDGLPVELNPGVHWVSFKSGSRPEIRKQTIVRAGEKGRIISASWDPARREPSPPAPTDSPERPAPRPHALAYAVAGLGLVALGSGLAVGFDARKRERSLKKDCAPFCDADDVRRVRTSYAAADVLGGVGAVGITAGVVLWLTHARSEPREASALPTLSVSTTHAELGWDVRF
jgi:hypothetical protein